MFYCLKDAHCKQTKLDVIMVERAIQAHAPAYCFR